MTSSPDPSSPDPGSPDPGSQVAELQRLVERDGETQPWALWGSYLPERQWGTVREDYSADGNAWTSFPHDHARSRTYRWGRMACWVCVMTSAASAFPWPFGMALIRS